MPCNVMEDFHRQIGLHLFKRDDGSALLTGTISDPFHDIVLEIDIALATLTVRALRVDFRKAPSSTCTDVVEQLNGLVGLTIGPGMSRKLTLALGGGAGCGNLRNLLQSLLPLVLNLSAASGIDDESEMLEAIRGRLIGTCAGYTATPSG